MSEKTEKRTVAIHTIAPKDGNYEFLNKALDGGVLGLALRERGIDLVVSHKSSFKDGVFYEPDPLEDGTFGLRPSDVTADEIGAVYSRVVAPLPYMDILGIPQLNPSNFKGLGASKASMRGLLGSLEIPTTILGVDSVEMADFSQSDKWVLKPVRGRLSKGFQRVPSDELKAKLSKFESHIIQPYVGIGRVPSDVHGVSKADQEIIEAARSKGLPAEIRIIAIQTGDDQTITAPLMRVSNNGADHIDGDDVYVDIVMQDKTAELLTSETLSIFKRVSEKAGVEGQPLIVAADYLFDGERMWAMEINLRSPTLPSTKKHPAASSILYAAMADTLDVMTRGTL